MFVDSFGPAVVIYWVIMLLIAAVLCLILWLIVRGAVLSALRQYRREGDARNSARLG